MNQNYTHEVVGEGKTTATGSDRSFCFVMAAASLIVGLHVFWFTSHFHLWVFCLSLIFLLAAILIPELFRPLNRAWMRLGALLQRIVNPMVLGVLFFGIFMPIGFFWRLIDKDPLRLKKSSGKTYWITRSIPSAPEKMKYQF